MDGDSIQYTHARNTRNTILCRLRGNRVVFGADEGLHGRVRWATLFSENTMNGETLLKKGMKTPCMYRTYYTCNKIKNVTSTTVVSHTGGEEPERKNVSCSHKFIRTRILHSAKAEGSSIVDEPGEG